MSAELWTEVDNYVNERLIARDPALEDALAASARAGLPAISVTPNQGKLLMLLARLSGARRILEVGTLGGYSTIWLARALPPEGRLITLELEPAHAAVARENLARAGVDHLVDVRVGRAADSLAALAAEGGEPFDFVFIDADKASYPIYFAWALKLARRGAAIVCDNVVRNGSIVDAHSDDPNTQGVRRLYDMLAAEPRIDAAAIQTVGGKGYDGLALVVVK